MNTTPCTPVLSSLSLYPLQYDPGAPCRIEAQFCDAIPGRRVCATGITNGHPAHTSATLLTLARALLCWYPAGDAQADITVTNWRHETVNQQVISEMTVLACDAHGHEMTFTLTLENRPSAIDALRTLLRHSSIALCEAWCRYARHMQAGKDIGGLNILLCAALTGNKDSAMVSLLQSLLDVRQVIHIGSPLPRLDVHRISNWLDTSVTHTPDLANGQRKPAFLDTLRRYKGKKARRQA